MAKILVAYFSATGTTGIAATALAEAAGADPDSERLWNGLKTVRRVLRSRRGRS